MEVAIDLDGIIADPYSNLQKRIHAEFGISIPCNEWTDPVFENLFPEIKRSWISEQFADPAFWENVDVFVEGMDWLERVIRKNRVNIVTARPDHCVDVTKEWMKKNRVPYTNIYHVPREEKHEMLFILNPKFMIEDDPRNALQISSVGIKCYIVSRPYNVNEDVGKAIRIDRLNQIGEL